MSIFLREILIQYTSGRTDVSWTGLLQHRETYAYFSH